MDQEGYSEGEPGGIWQEEMQRRDMVILCSGAWMCIRNLVTTLKLERAKGEVLEVAAVGVAV
jgi:hypothetical protein